MYRIGMGYDVHKVRRGRKLYLGGVLIPWEYGLEGHSDADVLLHAITDALLGALGLGDIGQHFPPTDARWKGQASSYFVQTALHLIHEAGWQVVNVDSTLLAQAPKLAPHYKAIRESVAKLLCIGPEAVSIKATTPEGLGSLGRGEGIAAYAVVLLERRASLQ